MTNADRVVIIARVLRVPEQVYESHIPARRCKFVNRKEAGLALTRGCALPVTVSWHFGHVYRLPLSERTGPQPRRC